MTVPGEIDWQAAGEALLHIEADLIHAEATELRGADFYAEALRRLWERKGQQWITRAEHARVLEINTSVDRSNLAQARATLAQMERDYRGRLAQAGTRLAEALRAHCNPVTVPSRYRREGVEIAARWISGRCEHGWPLPHTSPGGGGDPCPDCPR